MYHLYSWFQYIRLYSNIYIHWSDPYTFHCSDMDGMHTRLYLKKWIYNKKIIHRRKLNTTNKKKFVSIFLRYITPEKMYADIAFRILRCLNFQEVLYWYTYQLSTLLKFQFTVLLIIVSKLEPSFSSIFWNYCTYFIAAAHSL